MLFHLAWSILLEVFTWQTAFSLVEIFQQPIRNFQFNVFKANTLNRMDHTMWKSMKNCLRKWCQKLCAFLFAAIWAFGKMCSNFKAAVQLQIEALKNYPRLIIYTVHWVNFF